MTNNNVPEVRFDGFSEEWEIKKIDDIANETYGGGTPKTSVESYWKGTIPWLQSSDLRLDNFNVDIPTKYINEDSINNSAAKIIPANSIAVVTRVGVGKIALIPYIYATSQDFLSLSKLNVDINFALYLLYLNIVKVVNKLQGTSIKGITKSELLKRKVLLPREIKEQQKIGEFFKQLDDRIALQQRHVEQLKQSKQGFLQKMFPKDGESMPEVRFKEFSEKWGYYKLGDMKDVRDGTHESPKYQLEGHPLVTSKNLKDNGLDLNEVSLISDLDFEAINRRSKVNVGDILFGMIGTIGNPVLIERDDFAIKNVALIKENEKVKNQFLNQLLKSPVFDKYIRREIAGNTQKFLGLSKIRNFQLHIPIVEEQQKIGEFFKQLDDLIAKNERELELLQETKKGFLQKMFV